ncbi:protein kinase, ATP binding site-containing protein [Tanacetum coccineum]
MQVTLHYEAIVMQVTLHDKRIEMQVTLHYEAIVMQVTLHDKRIVMQVTLHYEAIVMQVTLHDKRIIKRATRNFKSRIGFEQYGEVYEGQFSGRWQNRLATIVRNNERNCHELEIISRFHHENIIAFIGYCDDDYDTIMVHEYATNGRLDKYLIEEDKRYYLTWAQRLRICIGAAKGLNYLHLGIEEHGRVIHRDFKSENVLLDNNLEAKICGFGLSELVQGNLPHPLVYKPAPFGKSYRDPIYKETSIRNTESDVYSYGIVMFEILTGMLANQERGIGESYRKQKLINMVRRCYDDGLEMLIDPRLRDHIDRRSFLLFTNIAYKCISFNIKDRPTMDEIVKKIEEALDIHNQQAASAIAKRRFASKRRFLIPLGDINKATKNFSEKTHIWAGYNMVYKGQLFDHWHNRTTAIKRYPRKGLEAKNMFHNELMLISSFHHENIVPFIGYCDESNEMIIVSEYAIHGSLNNHLKDPNKRRCITWAQRLNICIGVARGLKYLHSGLGEHERVIHGDIKSGQILLYENLEAKICGFGESFLVPRNHTDTQVYEGTVEHQYYIDPVYKESGIPKTESDVYSFGVVLFEILTGMLANQRKSIGDNEPLDLINLVQRYFDDGLDMLIDPHIWDEIDARALHTFTKIAYNCISFDIKERPSMNKIIKRMEEALYIQNHGAASTDTRINQNIADFLIPLIDINSAFGEKGQEIRIGDGGFGVVYKGQPSERWQNRTVAIKCLHPESYQGEHEFRNEIKIIFNFNHENIIPFIGYCDEGKEKIIVFEYASNGSLDRHLEDKYKRNCLTWERRLKIC